MSDREGAIKEENLLFVQWKRDKYRETTPVESIQCVMRDSNRKGKEKSMRRTEAATVCSLTM